MPPNFAPFLRRVAPFLRRFVAFLPPFCAFCARQKIAAEADLSGAPKKTGRAGRRK
ncbi:MAG: hypothetical protein HAW59_04265 [Betaproteobacteria bacterium]|nr:hypothetical protein [Betaproteobacteria bacterium]